jgi:hypothetical protein
VTSPTVIELMNAFSNNFLQQKENQRFSSVLTRKPSRVTVTIPWSLRQSLEERSDKEGRSLSNLIAYLLEASSEKPQ